jgi:hypothetical protein
MVSGAATALRSVAGAAIAIGLLAAPARAAIEPGDLVVADQNAEGGSGALIRVDPDSGRQLLLSSNAISGQGLLQDPVAVALTRDGSLLVADREAFGLSGGVIRVDPDTGQQSVLSSNLLSAADLFAEPSGIAVSGAGKIYVSDQDAFGGTGGVIGVDPDSGQQFAVMSNADSGLDLFEDPTGIAIEAGGDLAVSDISSPPGPDQTGAIVGVDLETAQQFLISSNSVSGADLFEDPYAVAAQANRDLLVANYSSDPAATGVIRVSRFSGEQGALAFGTFFSIPTGIDIDAGGQGIVADPNAFGGSGGLIRVDPDSGAQVPLSHNLISPPGLFVDPTGLLVVAPRCRGEYATSVGTDEKDTIIGTPGRDVIVTRGGRDIVEGRDGADLICGGNGRDRLTGGDGKDSFDAGRGPDVIRGDAGADVASGEIGGDRIDGGVGRDRLAGGKGNDKLLGRGAADKLFGNRSRDKLFGNDGDDLLNGGAGPDSLSGGPGFDRLRGGPGRDKREQ